LWLPRTSLRACTHPMAGIRSNDVDAWTFLWLMLFLKLPLIALFLLVRWAVRQTPETAPGSDGGIGPRLTTGARKGQCNPSHNAKELSQYGAIIGTGTVKF